jgi:TonB family protein
MKYAILLLIVPALLAGCAPGSQIAPSGEVPEIISLSPLPPLVLTTYQRYVELNVLFSIYDDGTVADVRILGSSGDAVWDAVAADSMRQWRFNVTDPPAADGTRWFRNIVRVEIGEPILLNIAELAVPNRDNAERLYRELRAGADFHSLAKEVRNGTDNEIGTYRGVINIARYPKHVRDQLVKLRVSGYTHPIRVGGEYVIYKRFDEQSANNVVR